MSNTAVITNAYRLGERSAKRALVRDRKRTEADALKDEGDQHYRAGRFGQAIACYEKAIATYGPRVSYLNNLTMAYLKVGRYEDVEVTANSSLGHNPNQVKARYRRALARKALGRHRAAMLDFEVVLSLDNANEDAARELYMLRETVRTGLAHAVPGNTDSYREDAELTRPNVVTHEFVEDETPVLSESSDWEHEGNNEPCQDYNREGCPMGSECPYKHAPDDLSMRDDLGRNVCIAYLLRMCNTNASECPYAHDTTYLPPGPWLDGPEWAAQYRGLFKYAKADGGGLNLARLAPLIKPVPAKGELFVPRVAMAARNEACDVFYRTPGDRGFENFGFH